MIYTSIGHGIVCQGHDTRVCWESPWEQWVLTRSCSYSAICIMLYYSQLQVVVVYLGKQYQVQSAYVTHLHQCVTVEHVLRYPPFSTPCIKRPL